MESFLGLLLIALCAYALVASLRGGNFSAGEKAAFKRVDDMRKAVKEAEQLMGVSKPPEADHAVNLTIKSKKPEDKPKDPSA